MDRYLRFPGGRCPRWRDLDFGFGRAGHGL